MITNNVPFVFFYGSLLTGTGNRHFDARLRGAVYHWSEGYIQARLYDLGAYAAAVTSSEKNDRVYGTVFRLRRADFLDRIDHYKLYRPDVHHHSEFIRRLTQITLLPARRAFTCWVYFYSATVAGRPRIRQGDYRGHLASQR
ncbi:MAG: gamma-glutamylcyclotransferase family protein [Pseudomonadota bacterium]